MKIQCLIYQCAVLEDITKQRQRLQEPLERYLKEHKDIVVFPELFLSGYFFDQKSLEDKFHNEEGIFVLGEIAKRHQCYSLGGVITKKGDNFFNSAIVINQNAEIQLNYHKTHLYSEFREDQYFLPGLEVGKFSLPVKGSSGAEKSIRASVLVCYDLVMSKRDPSWLEKIKETKPEIVFVIAQWPRDEEGVEGKGIHSWQILNSRLSRETRCPVIAVNRYGPGKDLEKLGNIFFAGHSGVFDYSQSHTSIKDLCEGEKVLKIEVELLDTSS